VAEYLRTQSLARIFLDNIENVQSSWVTQGPGIGQVALRYGANDFGSVMMEENVVSSAGTTFRLDATEIESLIRDAGYEPRRRNNWYQLLN
jgi:cyclic dehypoxanthinyl futalosine synthase